MEQIIFRRIRVQIYSEKIVRVELQQDGMFCDKNTFFIPDREQYAKNRVAYKQNANEISFGEYRLHLPPMGDGLCGLFLEERGNRIYTYKKQSNLGELPPVNQTPEVFVVTDSPRITVPKGGYSSVREGEYRVSENATDIYLLLCRRDFKELRRLYVELTGRCEFVRLSTLGVWNSKYFPYSEESAKELILEYERRGFPLDVMVLDTDWRSCGFGYEVNTRLFPDFRRLLDFAHGHGVEICLNDHPEPVAGSDVFSSEEILYRESNLQTLMKSGVDIWWYDRNWHTHLISPTESIRCETLGLYAFADITRNFYRDSTQNEKNYIRPVVMGNAVEIYHGDYESIQDSASHRYSLQWTGDIASDGESLMREIKNMLRCGENCIPYLSADIGGHTGNPDEIQYIRWLQFGVLSPIFRPHCNELVIKTREPWVYGESTESIAKEYYRLRYRLLPLIYGEAHNNYETGEPIFKSLAYEYSADRSAENIYDEYLLGKNILIAPIICNTPSPIGKEFYSAPVNACFYSGRTLEGKSIARATWDELQMSLDHASPVDGVPVYDFSARFKTKLKFDSLYSLFLRCDDGATVWIDGKKVLEDKSLHYAITFPLAILTPDIEHVVEIEYFQAGGEAFCGLYGYPLSTDGNDCREVYLPKGLWLNAFRGNVIEGGRKVNGQFSVKETPVFIRLGALIPLAFEAKNTAAQTWDRIVYDFYPDKESYDEGYLYEDDTKTTAYRFGEFQKSKYEARYCKEDNAFVVKLYGSEGWFQGEKCFTDRTITLKYHLFPNVNHLKKITVNGKNAEYRMVRKNPKIFPLSADDASCDSDTLVLKFTTDVRSDYEIKFFLGD